MEPAVCSVCGRPAVLEKLGKEGDWLNFADYQEEDKAALAHPDGLHYFCSEHVGPASKLVHMNSSEALDQLKSVYKPYSP